MDFGNGRGRDGQCPRSADRFFPPLPHQIDGWSGAFHWHCVRHHRNQLANRYGTLALLKWRKPWRPVRLPVAADQRSVVLRAGNQRQPGRPHYKSLNIQECPKRTVEKDHALPLVGTLLGNLAWLPRCIVLVSESAFALYLNLQRVNLGITARGFLASLVATAGHHPCCRARRASRVGRQCLRLPDR
jgi:hypothetical protein